MQLNRLSSMWFRLKVWYLNRKLRQREEDAKVAAMTIDERLDYFGA